METKENARIDPTNEDKNDGKLLLVLPFKMSDWATPYQEAMVFGLILQKTASEVRAPSLVIDHTEHVRDTKKIKIREHKKLLVMVFYDHVDRMELVASAAHVIGGRIMKKAQDMLYLYEKGVRMRYDVPGRIGRVTPEWSYHRRTWGKH